MIRVEQPYLQQKTTIINNFVHMYLGLVDHRYVDENN